MANRTRSPFDAAQPVPERVPAIVLGGSDRSAATLPDAGRDKHPLTGYKGAAIRVGGRPLIAVLLDRMRACGRFDPIWVAGPERVYAGIVGSAVIDTDGSFGGNIRTALEAVRRRRPGAPVAFLTCDVLPDPSTLAALMAEWDRAYPCDLWFPLVRVPERAELGTSAWKPAYRIAPASGAEPERVLPGHLVIVDPDALRREFLYRLFDMGYRTRNRSIDARRSAMLRGVIADMLLQDLRLVASLRPPTFTWSVLRAALPAASLLAKGRMSRPRLEDALRKVFVRYRHRIRHPDRRVVLPFVDALPLARDIDTVEEAEELGGELGGNAAS